MSLSVFDLFRVGIGPSSSHTVGPMRAAREFALGLAEGPEPHRVKAELFGSLGATGKGHGTDKAVILGLSGEIPESVDTDSIPQRMRSLAEGGRLRLACGIQLAFAVEHDLVFHRRKSLPYHPNGMRFSAYDVERNLLCSRSFYSVGGGFVVDEQEVEQGLVRSDRQAPEFPFHSAAELLGHCADNGMSISSLMMRNELCWRSRQEIEQRLHGIWQVMRDCVDKGCRSEGVLPGGMKVKRRAPRLFRQLQNETELNSVPLGTMDWVNLFALAVNEENAAGGRVVTAPTNGAAGIIPAVLHYYWRFSPGYSEEGVVRFLLTAGAIGLLYKQNASISGAEVGCQGEVGSACSMAAAALTEVLGGTPEQVENAAEIGMEHNLGLTCDPVGGLVQVPCIERNAMGAVKAINACRMALRGDGRHFVSLDKVIKTMRDTGADMKTKYKETARGGLAVNVIEC